MEGNMTLLFMYKRFLSRWRCLPSYCKICGRTIHDFSAPDATWEKVEPHINTATPFVMTVSVTFVER